MRCDRRPREHRQTGGGLPSAPRTRHVTRDNGGPCKERVVLFDDDSCYLGSSTSELIVARRTTVTIVTLDDTVGIVEYQHSRLS